MEPSSLVSALVGGLVAAWLVRWIRRRAASAPVAPTGDLRYPTGLKVVFWIGAAFFFGLVVVSNTVGKNATTTGWTTAAFTAFALLNGVMLWWMRSSVHVDADGLAYPTLLRRATMRWRDVVRVQYAPVNQWFVLESADGQKARLSTLLQGMPHAARLVLEHVPSSASVDSDTRAALKAFAQGMPPPERFV